MKLSLHVFCSALVLLVTTASYSKDIKGFYTFASAGTSTLLQTNSNVKFKMSPFGQVGVGYHLNDAFRSDISLQYREVKNKEKKSLSFRDARNVSLMWNIYLNLTDSQDDFRPYLTAGAGYGRNEMKKFTANINGINSTHHGGKNDTFIWNAGVGAIMSVSDRVGVDIGYRYVNLGDIKGTFSVAGGSPVKARIKDTRAHEFSVGLVVRL